MPFGGPKKSPRISSTVHIMFFFDPLGSVTCNIFGKVQVGKDQEKAQSEKDSHSKNRGEKKKQLTIRYLYHENIS